MKKRFHGFATAAEAAAFFEGAKRVAGPGAKGALCPSVEGGLWDVTIVAKGRKGTKAEDAALEAYKSAWLRCSAFIDATAHVGDAP